jgi:signal transduction histidine kinase
MSMVDAGKIRQVITNLIDNAIKYTPKGSVSVRLTKDVKRGKIIIAVADTGIGIEKATIPTLFAKFIRSKDANKVNVIGTGLGLYIVKEIVNGLHGRAWVESEGLGKGSTFFVELDEDQESKHTDKVTNFAKTM